MGRLAGELPNCGKVCERPLGRSWRPWAAVGRGVGCGSVWAIRRSTHPAGAVG